MRELIFCLVIFSLISSCAHLKTATSEKEPSEHKSDPLLIRFYRGPLNSLSAVRSSECPMYPSCSEYSKQCFQKYGAIIGWSMTCDRLMRCGRDEVRLSPTIFVNGKWKHYDPVETLMKKPGFSPRK
ncbi:membrane protein insertion efficiency factor YidD [Desulfococcaceae bacterium HSG8]|nr:membrane protein insertion efficiency factor YidD [Desulfococcaceae bacterium HSG8]